MVLGRSLAYQRARPAPRCPKKLLADYPFSTSVLAPVFAFRAPDPGSTRRDPVPPEPPPDPPCYDKYPEGLVYLQEQRATDKRYRRSELPYVDLTAPPTPVPRWVERTHSVTTVAGVTRTFPLVDLTVEHLTSPPLPPLLLVSKPDGAVSEYKVVDLTGERAVTVPPASFAREHDILPQTPERLARRPTPATPSRSGPERDRRSRKMERRRAQAATAAATSSVDGGGSASGRGTPASV